MPSTSAAQRRLFGAVLAAKRSGKPTFPMAQKIANQVSEKQAKDFASGPVQPKVPKLPTYL